MPNKPVRNLPEASARINALEGTNAERDHREGRLLVHLASIDQHLESIDRQMKRLWERPSGATQVVVQQPNKSLMPDLKSPKDITAALVVLITFAAQLIEIVKGLLH